MAEGSRSLRVVDEGEQTRQHGQQQAAHGERRHGGSVAQVALTLAVLQPDVFGACACALDAGTVQTGTRGARADHPVIVIH